MIFSFLSDNTKDITKDNTKDNTKDITQDNTKDYPYFTENNDMNRSLIAMIADLTAFDDAMRSLRAGVWIWGYEVLHLN